MLGNIIIKKGCPKTALNLFSYLLLFNTHPFYQFLTLVLYGIEVNTRCEIAGI